MRTHFLHYVHPKNEADEVTDVVSSRRMALINHNLLSVRIKMRFGEVDEAMFEGVKMPCEPIFFLLSIR
jgi:hypothetical protein